MGLICHWIPPHGGSGRSKYYYEKYYRISQSADFSKFGAKFVSADLTEWSRDPLLVPRSQWVQPTATHQIISLHLKSARKSGKYKTRVYGYVDMRV